jgi:UDP-GlcNAc:undecaprenyl-phosphate GlcNAc-1-phosphate transferase
MMEVLEHPGAHALMALLLTLLFCFVLTPVARRFGWADEPDWRKQHEGSIPLAGGPAIVLAVFAVMMWVGGWSDATVVLGWSSAIVFVTGLVDDRQHIKVPLRFALQILALLCMVWLGGVELHNFGNLLWERLLGLGPLAVPITIFSALGVINAFNMIDGMDGLSGSIALVALAGLAFLAGRGGFVEEHNLLLIICAAVLGFLLLNFRFKGRENAHVFLGDSGSSWLGFVLAWYLIALSQDNPTAGVSRAYAPVIAIWLFALPLMDTIYVMTRRARLGDPIFGADRRHLHHLFLRSGFSVRQTWLAMVSAALLMALVGILAELRGWPEWAMFYAFMALSFSYLAWIDRAWKQRRFLGRAFQ